MLTDKHLNYESHHPLVHKIAVVQTLQSRANTHCTFASDHVEESKRISRALPLNGYVRKWSQHHQRTTPTQRQEDDRRIRVSMPYVWGTSRICQGLYAVFHQRIALEVVHEETMPQTQL